MAYKLRAQLAGHTEDVRGVCACSDQTIATGSRDKTVRLWRQDPGSQRFELVKTFKGHRGYVGPVAYIPPRDGLPEGGLLSGGMDSDVRVWSLGSPDAVEVLRGHTGQVTSVAVGQDALFSASVDRTARKWVGKHPAEVYSDHKDPVQAIIVLPDGVVVTGSTDCTIKLWSGPDCIRTIHAHTDTVRGLALVPGVGFLSASHDGTAKLWSPDGDKLLEMIGHKAIVYSIAAHSLDLVASGSEDNTAKVWKGGECVQSIEHPGCVWSVHFLPNGDLITACSDGVARVWTQDPSRSAPPEEVAAYEAVVHERSKGRETVGGVNVSALPGPEALSKPGTSDGQTKIIREGNIPVAYSWSLTEFKWIKLGELVDGPEESLGNKTVNGVAYDFVFDVDIGDSVMRKLPCNRGDNPYDVAYKWLAAQDLPLAYTQQIVDFIVQNTGQPQQQLDDNFYDPYTGGNAYVPSQAQRPAPQAPSSFRLKHTPRKEILLFEAAKYEPMLQKIIEFNGTQVASALTPDELESVKGIVTTLMQNPPGKISEGLDIVLDKLLKWPAANVFPVLDLVRVLVLHPQAAAFFARHTDLLMDVAKAAMQTSLLPNMYLSARIFVNAFRHDCFREWLLDHYGQILDMFSDLKAAGNKNLRSSYVHLMMNYTVRLVEARNEAGQIQVLSAAIMVAEQETEPELKFLALQAISTLVHSGSMKSLAADMDAGTIALEAKKSSVAKVAEVGADLELLLK